MKEVHIPDIGIVRLNKHGKARKHFNIRVSQDGSVEVSIPPGESYRNARTMIISIKDKILRSKQKIKKQKAKITDKRTVFHLETTFYTRGYRVKIIRKKSSMASYYLHPHHDKLLIVEVPSQVKIENKEIQAFIRKAIEHLWRYEAKTYIPGRVHALATQHDLHYSGVGITGAHTRWGSCSSTNKLNFSLHLMMLPDKLIDYVILHELAHTVHKNHSKDFYGLLETLSGGKHQENKQKLKSYHIGMY
ncbi:MAG: YgjP-like metallopeptidase domain-containing protein [Bacteroidota bacterium]|nr:YgjP-like metallopeptidase domain-containing protein [Bacteroidota bacterium]